MIGTILRHRYKIIQKLGGGGIGETYLAEDLNIPVTPKPRWVVKRLHPQMMHPDIQRLFEKEAAILYKLGQKHDRIPKLSEFFQVNGEFYLIQEFIEGQDLSKEITPGKQMSEAYVVKQRGRGRGEGEVRTRTRFFMIIEILIKTSSPTPNPSPFPSSVRL